MYKNKKAEIVGIVITILILILIVVFGKFNPSSISSSGNPANSAIIILHSSSVKCSIGLFLFSLHQ